MMADTKIEWADYTFNPWIGCTKVSPACANCYAERDFDHRYGKAKWGPNGTRVLTSDANWRKPLAWNKAAAESSTRPRVFCASLADVFEDWQGPILDGKGNQILLCDLCGRMHPEDLASFSECCQCSRFKQRMEYASMDDVRQRLFDLIDATPNLDWLLLTKRPENIIQMWRSLFVPHPMPGYRGQHERMQIKRRENVWLGTSVEDQKWADRRIPQLLKCRDLSPVLFLSCEPVVGPIDLTHVVLKESDAPELGKPDVSINCLRGWYGTAFNERAKIDWVITGGESGPGARPADPDWFRSLRDQCAATNTPFHFKQWGEWAGLNDTNAPLPLFTKADNHAFDEETIVYRIGKKAAGRFLDGQLHDGFPEWRRAK